MLKIPFRLVAANRIGAQTPCFALFPILFGEMKSLLHLVVQVELVVLSTSTIPLEITAPSVGVCDLVV